MVCKSASRRTALAMAVFLMLATLWLCPALTAQTASTPVIASQAVGLGKTDWTSTQVRKVIISSKGDVITQDGQSNAIYQFPADGSGVKTLVGPPPNVFGTGQWAIGGIAVDADDNLYICHRWQGYVLKIPYDPVKKTWNVVISDSTKWGINAGPAWWYSAIDVAYTPANAKGYGNFIISDESPRVIFQWTGTGQNNGKTIVGGLLNRAFKTALDREGNVYFHEDMSEGGVLGVFRVPAGVYDLKGTSNGDLEKSWPVCGTPESMPTSLDPDYKDRAVPLQKPCRVDNNLGKGIVGVTVDFDGNVFIADEVDQFNAADPNNTMNGGVFKVPVKTFDVVINGAAYQVRMPSAADMILVAPIPSQGSPAVDPKGDLYVALWASGWNGIKNIGKVYIGSAAVPPAPVGQTGAISPVMFAFNSSVTPDEYTVSQGADAQDFSATAGTCATGTTYTKYQRCNVDVALTPQVVGPTSGQLEMKQAGKTVAAAYVHGVGQGAGLAVLTPAATMALRSGLQSPKQVTTDRWGNFYVADAGSGSVLKYIAGSTDATQPTAIGSGFTAPTGVAVDGAGNVYVADSGKVIEVPFGGGAQIELQAGLGGNLSLTVDGAGNVYVADPEMQRVVKVPNADARRLSGTFLPTMGSGFVAPTAVAADDNGNLLVVDGTTLYQVFSSGGQTPITNELNSPLGVAQDASGAAYIAQPGGVIRIPNIGGAYDFTAKAMIGVDVATPTSVAVAPSGTVYITDGETPGVLAVGVGGATDFGYVNLGTTSKQTATLVNIGNQPLTFNSPLYTSDGPNTADFSIPDPQSASLNPGLTQSVDLIMSPVSYNGPLADNGSIHSNAANVASVPFAMTGIGSNGAPAVATITFTPNQPVYPNDVVVTVSVAPESGTGTPTGKLVLSVDGQPAKPASLQNGAAQFTLKRPNGGTHTLSASYQGDMNYAAASATAEISIARAATSSTMAPPVQDPTVPGIFILYQHGDLVTAKVSSPSGLPTGSVVFKEGSTELGVGTLDANGYATFNTQSLALGTHVIVGTYSGDPNFNGSDSASMTLQVVNPSIYIAAQPPALTLTPGTPGSTKLTLTSLVTFKGKVQLFCANLPQYSECTFDTPSPTVEAGKPQVVEVTISTNVPINIGANHPAGRPGVGFAWVTTMFAVGLVGMVFGKKTRYNGRVLMFICSLLIISSALTGLTACAGNGYTKTPAAPHVISPSGTIAVTIQATNASGVVSLPFTVNVTVK